MKGCSVPEGRQYVMLKVLGFNESARVNIQRKCGCQCVDSIKHKKICIAELFQDARSPSFNGSSWTSRSQLTFEQCKMQKDHPVCSGHGGCVGGNCICHKSKFGTIYGKYCEKDDFSCPYHLGNLCAGKLQNVTLSIHLMILVKCLIYLILTSSVGKNSP